MPVGATYTDWVLRQGNTESPTVNFRESQVPQSGTDVVLKFRLQRNNVTPDPLFATLSLVEEGDPAYDESVPKWKAVWSMSTAYTRALALGSYAFEIEVWRGGTEETYIYGTFKVIEGINVDD